MASTRKIGSQQFPVSTPAELGQVLRGFRQSLGLTQAQVARLGGMLPKTISALEHDPSRASFESLHRLLGALKLQLVVRARAPAPKTEW